MSLDKHKEGWKEIVLQLKQNWNPRGEGEIPVIDLEGARILQVWLPVLSKDFFLNFEQQKSHPSYVQHCYKV